MSRISTGDPRNGSQLALQAIAAVVLGGGTLAGGRGSPIGTFIGVVLLAVVQSALTFNNVQTFWNGAVFGLVLIFAVVVTAIGDLRRRRFGARPILASFFRRNEPVRVPSEK
jgi:ribose/xylose/arabinose/galactoside ABC-type transport system permease subunit